MTVDLAVVEVSDRAVRRDAMSEDRKRASVRALHSVLSGEIPAGLPRGAKRLAARLREDDELATRVWSHPIYLGLIEWAREYCPLDYEVWEAMAGYALSRAALFQAGVLDAASVRGGMIGTASWVRYRGRYGERLDIPEPSIDALDLVDYTVLAPANEAEPSKPGSPVDYLVDTLAGEVPKVVRATLDKAWDVAREHYTWLAGITGLRGEELVAAGRTSEDVNAYRRLGRRLPPEWPAATRKAIVHLLAGTPRSSGLLVWWATVPGQQVPDSVKSQWRGLVTVINPAIGRMPDADRRLLREQAQRWRPPEVDCDQGVAV